MEFVYRYRHECSIDSVYLRGMLPSGELLSFQSVPLAGGLPDECVEIRLKSFSLDQLRDLMRQVRDGHVMVQTVQTPELFTGERDWEIETEPMSD